MEVIGGDLLPPYLEDSPLNYELPLLCGRGLHRGVCPWGVSLCCWGSHFLSS